MAFNNNRTNLPAGSRPLPAGTHPATYGDSPASGPAQHTAGHHRHDLLNKLDPSVDSSRDKVPLPPPGTATNGPHSSRLANKLDPTVDTSAYENANLAGVHPPQHRQGGIMGGSGSRAGATGAMHGAGVGHGQSAPGMGPMGAGYGQPAYGASVGHGQHQYNGQYHVAGTSHLPGPAPNTAGPHRSDLLNKLDPSVDSTGGMTTGRGQRRGI